MVLMLVVRKMVVSMFIVPRHMATEPENGQQLRIISIKQLGKGVRPAAAAAAAAAAIAIAKALAAPGGPQQRQRQ